jgi:hypothetical protein
MGVIADRVVIARVVRLDDAPGAASSDNHFATTTPNGHRGNSDDCMLLRLIGPSSSRVQSRGMLVLCQFAANPYGLREQKHHLDGYARTVSRIGKYLAAPGSVAASSLLCCLPAAPDACTDPVVVAS